ncbi:MAG TPA: cation:proton antiporter [Paludibacter sp.]|nr:cation:proton antiporter [Paludibacter sp.]
MRQIKNSILYVLIIGIFSALMYSIVLRGTSELETGRGIVHQVSTESHWAELIHSLFANLEHPFAILLAQIITILIAARFFSFLCKKMAQPTVIGEIIAGIVLGPSLVGMYFPGFYETLFPVQSMGNLQAISQLGLILFMFIIGMELDLKVLRNKAHEAVVISHASVIIPFTFGMGLAYFIYRDFAPEGVKFSSFGLFLGIAMSITAFPVLARIIQEKGMHKTKLGAMVITCAAVDDITAWCLLAIVIAIVKAGSFVSALYIIILAVVYILVMIKVVRPFLKRIGDLYSSKENLSKPIVAFFFLALIVSAYATELIGIHALFGAFMAGAIMPENEKFRRNFVEKVEDVSLVLLLPLYFVFTGLRTKIGLIDSPSLWIMTSAIILVAITGKFIGSAITAKVVGQNWKDSLTIGILMNTRGLVELVVLNIGYDLGVLSPQIFTMMVIMALVTTFMTTPVLALIQRLMPEKEIEQEFIRTQAQGIFKAIIALGNPENGSALLKVGKTVLDGTKNSLEVTVLHITPGSETNPIYSEQFARDSFNPIIEEAHALDTPIQTMYRITDNIEMEIVRSVNYHNFDFLLVGAGISLSGIPFIKESSIFRNFKGLNQFVNSLSKKQVFFYPGSLIKDKTRYFIENSNCSVGVFVNRGFTQITSTLVLLHLESDEFLLRYARRLLKNNQAVSITVLDANKLAESSGSIRLALGELRSQFPDKVKVSKLTRNSSTVLMRHSFMLISYQSWNILSVSDKKELEHIPSTLIINKKTSRFHSGAKYKMLVDEAMDPVAESF